MSSLTCPTLPAPVDLHAHSTASDGTLAPADVVRAAHAAGLSALALTDHDTTAGLAEAGAAAVALGLDFLPGIEVSTAFPRPGTMHLLGYGFDPTSAAILDLTARLADARAERVERIVDRLNRVGVDLSLVQVRAEIHPDLATVGRPHLADLLVRRGIAVGRRDAFDRFLGGGGVAYVDTSPFDAEHVIAAVTAGGGVVSLAHPLQLRRQTWAQLEALVRELAEQGLAGLETIHTTHDADTVHRLTRLADRLDLLPTGGSDFHGPHKGPGRIGVANGRQVPRSFYEAIARPAGTSLALSHA